MDATAANGSHAGESEGHAQAEPSQAQCAPSLAPAVAANPRRQRSGDWHQWDAVRGGGTGGRLGGSLPESAAGEAAPPGSCTRSAVRGRSHTRWGRSCGRSRARIQRVGQKRRGVARQLRRTGMRGQRPHWSVGAPGYTGEAQLWGVLPLGIESKRQSSRRIWRQASCTTTARVLRAAGGIT